jgi:hypothetical protein
VDLVQQVQSWWVEPLPTYGDLMSKLSPRSLGLVVLMLFRRSLPMSFYALAAVGGTGLGPAAAGWIEMNPHLQWRWIQWIHMMSDVSYHSIWTSDLYGSPAG